MITTLDKLDDNTARGVLVEVLRATVAKTRPHLSSQKQRRILRLLAEATTQVYDDLGG